MLSAPAGEWCPFEKQPSYCFSAPKAAAQRRDVFPFPSSGRLGRMIAVLLWLPRPGRATWKCSSTFAILMTGPFFSVLAWAWRKLIYRTFSDIGLFVSMWELAFLRAATGSSRRRNLQSVLLWLEEQESMEAFDFAFGPMKEPELGGLRKLTLTGKIFPCFQPPGLEESVAADRWLLQRAIRTWCLNC